MRRALFAWRLGPRFRPAAGGARSSGRRGRARSARRPRSRRPVQVDAELAEGGVAVPAGEGEAALGRLHRRLGAQDVHPRRLPGLEDVTGLPEPVPGESQRLLLHRHERVASHDLDVVRGRAEQDPVLGGADALLSRAHALLGLLVGALLAQAREDRLLQREAQVPVVQGRITRWKSLPPNDLLAVRMRPPVAPTRGGRTRGRSASGVGRAHLGPCASDARSRRGPAGASSKARRAGAAAGA
jgi:hypothetical protein